MASGPIAYQMRSRNGLAADLLVSDLMSRRDSAIEHKKVFSDKASALGLPDRFLPAVHKTLSHAFHLARTVELERLFPGIAGGDEHSQLVCMTEQEKDLGWAKNLDNIRQMHVSWHESLHLLRKSVALRDVLQMIFRIIEYEQRTHVNREIGRRVTNGAPRPTAERNVLAEL